MRLVITGAASGIGRACAKLLATDPPPQNPNQMLPGRELAAPARE